MSRREEDTSDRPTIVAPLEVMEPELLESIADDETQRRYVVPHAVRNDRVLEFDRAPPIRPLLAWALWAQERFVSWWPWPLEHLVALAVLTGMWLGAFIVLGIAVLLTR